MPFLTALAVDVATTGADPRSDAVVEIASVAIRIDLDTGRHDIFQTLSNALVDPGREIPATASAVHHLTAEHVRGQPALAQALESLCQAASAYRPTMLVAHDAAFAAGFLPDLAPTLTPEHPGWVCTLRLARHAWPDAPSFGSRRSATTGPCCRAVPAATRPTRPGSTPPAARPCSPTSAAPWRPPVSP